MSFLKKPGALDYELLTRMCLQKSTKQGQKQGQGRSDGEDILVWFDITSKNTRVDRCQKMQAFHHEVDTKLPSRAVGLRDCPRNYKAVYREFLDARQLPVRDGYASSFIHVRAIHIGHRKICVTCAQLRASCVRNMARKS